MSPSISLVLTAVLMLLRPTSSQETSDPVRMVRQSLKYWRGMYKAYHEEVALGYCWADYFLGIQDGISRLPAPRGSTDGDSKNSSLLTEKAARFKRSYRTSDLMKNLGNNKKIETSPKLPGKIKEGTLRRLSNTKVSDDKPWTKTLDTIFDVPERRSLFKSTSSKRFRQRERIGGSSSPGIPRRNQRMRYADGFSPQETGVIKPPVDSKIEANRDRRFGSGAENMRRKLLRRATKRDVAHVESSFQGHSFSTVIPSDVRGMRLPVPWIRRRRGVEASFENVPLKDNFLPLKRRSGDFVRVAREVKRKKLLGNDWKPKIPRSRKLSPEDFVKDGTTLTPERPSSLPPIKDERFMVDYEGSPSETNSRLASSSSSSSSSLSSLRVSDQERESGKTSDAILQPRGFVTTILSSLRQNILFVTMVRTLGMFVYVGRQFMNIVESNKILTCTRDYLWSKTIKWIDT